MASRKETSRKKAEERFLKAVRSAAEQNPEGASRFALAKIASKPKAEARRCIRWGIDPVTGKSVCLEYA